MIGKKNSKRCDKKKKKAGKQCTKCSVADKDMKTSKDKFVRESDVDRVEMEKSGEKFNLDEFVQDRNAFWRGIWDAKKSKKLKKDKKRK